MTSLTDKGIVLEQQRDADHKADTGDTYNPPYRIAQDTEDVTPHGIFIHKGLY